MSISTSIVTQLLSALPHWRSQMYFKSSLIALSHAMEDQILAGKDRPLVIASFQKERYYRQEAHRYRRIAEKTDQVYVLSAPEAQFTNGSEFYETIAFEPADALNQEWHLVIIGPEFSSCLICREKLTSPEPSSLIDNNRRFEGIWTFDRQVGEKVASLLLKKIKNYRPELAEKIKLAQQTYLTSDISPQALRENQPSLNPDPFAQRLITYLQAGQYKLIKANRTLATKEQKERLLNSITAAIRRSLNTEEILQLAAQKLGEGLDVCRCVIYRCQETDEQAIVKHEFLNQGITSIKNQHWPLKDNPLFQEILEYQEPIIISDVQSVSKIQDQSEYILQNLVQSCSILSWLLVPVLYQGRLLGMVELHHCGPEPITWKEEDVELVNAIATQIGVALIQAQAYSNLQDLNEQLAALDRTRSNLVAITGHELRTPLSTIQVCLESLSSEPDMSLEMRQIMLSTALQDAERMRSLIQDFLTLSQLESGRIQWNVEALSLEECIELSISHVKARQLQGEGKPIPQLINKVPLDMPLVQADGEWLVEVFAKLLDNACKFTDSDGQIAIESQLESETENYLKIMITDTGRGIEPNRLETVFDRFYQEEGALRRSTGGTGLGLAICRQIVRGWGGRIWAESKGKDQGTQFCFTVPIYIEVPKLPAPIQKPESRQPSKTTTTKGRKKRP